MWLTDSINPAQEHFISNLIRQKVIAAIDGQYNDHEILENSKKYMLFLPEGDLHELSLLFANYLIQARKNKVVYLGQNMPFFDLRAAHIVYEPDFLLTVITSKPQDSSASAYLAQLSEQFPNTQILVSGSQVIGQDLELPENVTTISNPNQLVSFVEEQSKIAVNS